MWFPGRGPLSIIPSHSIFSYLGGKSRHKKEKLKKILFFRGTCTFNLLRWTFGVLAYLVKVSKQVRRKEGCKTECVQYRWTDTRKKESYGAGHYHGLNLNLGLISSLRKLIDRLPRVPEHIEVIRKISSVCGEKPYGLARLCKGFCDAATCPYPFKVNYQMRQIA